jgi:hypothetical protein
MLNGFEPPFSGQCVGTGSRHDPTKQSFPDIRFKSTDVGFDDGPLHCGDKIKPLGFRNNAVAG